ncbi:MAG: hypothetical protein AAGN82_15950, partial [Myxococcota bacterium]
PRPAEAPPRESRPATSNAAASSRPPDERDAPRPSDPDRRGRDVAAAAASAAPAGSATSSSSPRHEARPAADGEEDAPKPAFRVPRGHRVFGRAFARELPFAVSRDPVWETLPLGRLGVVTVEASIGDDGRIQDLVVRKGAPAPLVAAVKRTRPSLGGRFCLSAGAVAGREVLRIDVTLEQRDPPPNQKIHYDVSRRPTSDTPGRVFFVTERGRTFVAGITIASSTPRDAP